MSHTDSSIEALYSAWREAFRRQDVDTVMGLLTPDYVLWAPGAPPVGREELRPRLVSAFAAYDLVPEFESVERIISGDLAVESGCMSSTSGPAREERPACSANACS